MKERACHGLKIAGGGNGEARAHEAPGLSVRGSQAAAIGRHVARGVRRRPWQGNARAHRAQRQQVDRAAGLSGKPIRQTRLAAELRAAA